MFVFEVFDCIWISATATATTVAKGVAKDIPYFKAWRHSNSAVAIDVATNLDGALYTFISLTVSGETLDRSIVRGACWEISQGTRRGMSFNLSK